MTDAETKKNFSFLYEELVSRLDSVRGLSNNPPSYLVRQEVVPKAEVDDPATAYATLDHQIIQRAQIVKDANVNDDVLEHAGPSKKNMIANADNAILFELLKSVFGETQLWIHTKPTYKDRNGHRAMADDNR